MWTFTIVEYKVFAQETWSDVSGLVKKILILTFLTENAPGGPALDLVSLWAALACCSGIVSQFVPCELLLLSSQYWVFAPGLVKKKILILTFLTPSWLFTATFAKSETVDGDDVPKWRLHPDQMRLGKNLSFGWRCKPLEAFLEIQPFQLEIQTHKSWLPPECQFYGDNPISYFPARHFQTLRSGKCF